MPIPLSSSSPAALTTVEAVEAFLAGTPFASQSIQKISGGYINYVYRIHLVAPLNGHPSVILKHAQEHFATDHTLSFDSMRQVSSNIVRSPRNSVLKCSIVVSSRNMKSEPWCTSNHGSSTTIPSLSLFQISTTSTLTIISLSWKTVDPIPKHSTNSSALQTLPVLTWESLVRLWENLPRCCTGVRAVPTVYERGSMRTCKPRKWPRMGLTSIRWIRCSSPPPIFRHRY